MAANEQFMPFFDRRAEVRPGGPPASSSRPSWRSVRLSASPCHRRLRALESSGVISGYRAQVDARSLGLTFEALVFVTMNAADRATVDAFEEAVAAIPQVVHAQRLFGDPDYLLRVLARDLPAYQELYDGHIATLPGVQRLRSTLVMKSVVEDRPLLL
jgi:DNA-binding Lrp family transcriptional regulator